MDFLSGRHPGSVLALKLQVAVTSNFAPILQLPLTPAVSQDAEKHRDFC